MTPEELRALVQYQNTHNRCYCGRFAGHVGWITCAENREMILTP